MQTRTLDWAHCETMEDHGFEFAFGLLEQEDALIGAALHDIEPGVGLAFFVNTAVVGEVVRRFPLVKFLSWVGLGIVQGFTPWSHTVTVYKKRGPRGLRLCTPWPLAASAWSVESALGEPRART